MTLGTNSLQNYLSPQAYAEMKAAKLLADARARQAAEKRTHIAPLGLTLDWRTFLERYFPQHTIFEFAPHHVEFWKWVWQLRKGVRPRPFVAVWARGGAKSSSAELAAAAVVMRQVRRYVIYVSATQDLADKHVATIAGLLEGAGVERAVNKYGNSKGWRRERLRAANGTTIDALGLDTAARGIKVDQDRPDLMIFDDIDERHDTGGTTQKKIDTLTNTILPAGANDNSVLAVQNLIHRNSIFAKLVNGEADFLSDRILSGPIPALRDLAYEFRDGQACIIRGEPTWAGQSVDVAQGQIRTWGLRSFLREAQHDVVNAEQTKFKRAWFEIVDAAPADLSRVRYYDLAATEKGALNDPDFTAGALMGRDARGLIYILDFSHVRAEPLTVEALIRQNAMLDGTSVPIWIEQEPGASGKNTIDHYVRNVLQGFTVRGDRVSGNKLERADPLAAQAQAGNVKLIRGTWNKEFLDEAETFPDGAHDDMIDAASGAFSRLTLNQGALLAQEAKRLRDEMERRKKDMQSNANFSTGT